MLNYITAIVKYYKLSTVTLGSNQTKKKKINIQISRKISLNLIMIWIISSLFFVLFSMGIDPINQTTIHNNFTTTSYNKAWLLYMIVAIIIMILTMIKSIFLFKKLEHKPLAFNIYQREKPSNLRPAHVRILLHDGLVDEISLASTILDLIDRNYLSIENCETSKNCIFKNKNIVLSKTKKNTDDLLKFEKFIIEWFIDKYSNNTKISFQEIENRLKNNTDTEQPCDLFENWVGLVYLSFPLKKFYKECNHKAYNSMYILFIILAIIPIFPFIRTFRYIRLRMSFIFISNILIK